MLGIPLLTTGLRKLTFIGCIILRAQGHTIEESFGFAPRMYTQCVSGASSGALWMKWLIREKELQWTTDLSAPDLAAFLI